MAQYCRYCSHFVTGNGNWCDARKIEPSDRYAKSTNRCRFFDLNPMDAFFENEKGYQPRKTAKKNWKQIRMEV